MRNRQIGPDDAADVLAALVPRVTYKPGWTFQLAEVDRGQGCQGLTLMIGATVPESFGRGTVDILHLMPVLPAAYDEESWARWILEQIEMVERHEMLEFFRVDGQQPYFPAHGPGQNPYAMRLITTPDRAHAEATPWYGGAASDPHFQETP